MHLYAEVSTVTFSDDNSPPTYIHNPHPRQQWPQKTNTDPPPPQTHPANSPTQTPSTKTASRPKKKLYHPPPPLSPPSPPSPPPHPTHTNLPPPHPTQALLRTSAAQKASANALFSTSRYSEAIGEYDKALSTCPNYLDYETAVLRSNIAACHLKLLDWKAAVAAATSALDALARLEPPPATDQKTAEEKGDAVVEISGSGALAEAEQLERLQLDDKRKEDVRRIRAKALMRRGKARSELGGWGELQGAEEGA